MNWTNLCGAAGLVVWLSAGGLALGAVEQRAQRSLPAGLTSPDWHERARAFESIRKDPFLVREPGTRQALIELLERENEHTRNITLGVIEPDEAYSEYRSQVCDFAVRAYGLQDDDLLRVLVFGSYNYDSEFGRQLVAEGPRVVPLLLELSAHEIGPKRWNGVWLLGEILGQDRFGRYQPALPDWLRAQAKAAIVAGTGHSEVVTRRVAAEALGRSLDPSMIPHLERLAATDPDDGRGSPSRIQFDVRHQALRAIERIKLHEKR